MYFQTSLLFQLLDPLLPYYRSLLVPGCDPVALSVSSQKWPTALAPYSLEALFRLVLFSTLRLFLSPSHTLVIDSLLKCSRFV